MAIVPRTASMSIWRSPAGKAQLVTRTGTAPMTMDLDQMMPTATPAELDTLEAHGGVDVAGAVKAERARRSKGGRVDPRAVGKRDVMAEATGHTEPPPGGVDAPPDTSRMIAEPVAGALSQPEKPSLPGRYARADQPLPAGANLSPEDRDYLIRTIIGEAANQGALGQEAVAHVIMNRVHDGWAPSVKDVVLQPGQFEPWMTRRGELLGIRPDAPEYLTAARAVDQAMLAGADPTGGAVHFLNPQIVRGRTGGTLPAWAQGKPSAVIGQHAFFTSPARGPGVDTMMAQGQPLPAGTQGVDLPPEPKIGLPDITGGGGVPSLVGGAGPDDVSGDFLAYRQVAQADDAIARARARQTALRAAAAPAGAGQAGAAADAPAAAAGAALATPDATAAAKAATQARQAGAAAAGAPGASLYPADAEQVRAAQSIIAPQTAPPAPAKPLTWEELRHGVEEAPGQAVGGVFDAAKELFTTADHIADWLEEKIPTAQLIGGTGESPPEAIARLIGEASPHQPKSRVGAVVRGFTGFAAPFGWLAGKVRKVFTALGIGEGVGARIGAGALAGAATGAAAVDPFAPGIANLVQEFPALQNPVTDYLARQPGDTEGEAKLKTALEAAGFGVLVDGMLQGFRAIRSWRAARDADAGAPATDAERLAAEQAAKYPPVGDEAFKALGDPSPDAPLIRIRKKPAADVVAAGAAATAAKAQKAAARPAGAAAPVTDMTAVQFLDADKPVFAWSKNGDPKAVLGDRAPELSGYQSVSKDTPSGGVRVWYKPGEEGRANTIASLMAMQERAGISVLDRANMHKEIGVLLGYPRDAAQGFADDYLARMTKPVTAQDIAATTQSNKLATAAELTDTGGVPADVTGNAVLGKGEPAGALPDSGDVYINFAKIEGDAEIRAVIGRMAKSLAPQIKAEARGVQSFEATKALAADLDMTVDDLLSRQKGQPFNAETALAARQLWAASSAKLIELAKIASGPNAGPVDAFNFRRMMATHAAIQAEVIGARTETARALGAWRIPAGGAERGKAIQDLLDASGGTATAGQMAQMIAKLGEQGVTPGALSTAIRKSWAAKAGDTLREIYINALLSGLKTLVVNPVSNSLAIGQTIAEAGTGRVISRVAGRGAADSVAPGEAAAMSYAVISSFKDALVLSARDLKAGGGVLDFVTGEAKSASGKVEHAPAISSETYGISTGSGLGRAVDLLGAIVRSPTRVLSAQDTFFKVIGYRMAVAKYAVRQATQEGLSGQAFAERVASLKADPPESIRMASVDAAEYQTFTNALGKTGRAGMHIRDELGPLGWMILPFMKTPANIIKYSFERTPLALTVRRWREDIAAGGARRDLAMGRMALGSAIMATTADYAEQGLISGAGPNDQSQREDMMRQGWRPWSVKVGDKWYSYNRADPLGMTLGIAATMAEVTSGKYMDEGDADSVNEIIAAALTATSETVINKTYLQGLADLSEAMNDPTRYSAQYINGMLAGFVPNAINFGTQVIDPTLRERQGLGDAALAKIQAFAEKMPARRDLWGYPLSSATSGFGNVFDATTPVAVSRVIDSPIDREIGRLGVTALRLPKGNQSWGTSLGGTVSVNLRDWPQVYERYSELAGHALKLPYYEGKGAKEYLDALVSGRGQFSKAYAASSDGQDGDKATMIKAIMQEYRKAARDAIMADPKYAAFATYVRQLQAQQMQKQLQSVQ